MSLKQTLRLIDQEIRALYPAYFATLRPPATDDALATLRAHVDAPLPDELVEFWRWHDGAGFDSFDPSANWMLASIEMAIEARDVWAEGENGGEWQPSWVPIMDNGAGDQLVYDLTTGQVIAAYHEEAMRPVEFTSLTAWADAALAKFRGKRFDVSAFDLTSSERRRIDTPSCEQLRMMPLGTVLRGEQLVMLKVGPDQWAQAKREAELAAPSIETLDLRMDAPLTLALGRAPKKASSSLRQALLDDSPFCHPDMVMLDGNFDASAFLTCPRTAPCHAILSELSFIFRFGDYVVASWGEAIVKLHSDGRLETIAANVVDWISVAASASHGPDDAWTIAAKLWLARHQQVATPADVVVAREVKSASLYAAERMWEALCQPIVAAVEARALPASVPDIESLVGRKAMDERVLDFWRTLLPELTVEIDEEEATLRGKGYGFALAVMLAPANGERVARIDRIWCDPPAPLSRGMTYSTTPAAAARLLGPPSKVDDDDRPPSRRWDTRDLFLRMRWQKGGRQVEDFILWRPTPAELLEVANELDGEECIAWCNDALERDPNAEERALASRLRGAQLFLRGDVAGAIADYTRAIECADPPTRGDYANRAEAYVMIADLARAKADLDAAERSEIGEDEDQDDNFVIYVRGTFHEANGDLRAARADYRAAAKLGNDQAKARLR